MYSPAVLLHTKKNNTGFNLTHLKTVVHSRASLQNNLMFVKLFFVPLVKFKDI